MAPSVRALKSFTHLSGDGDGLQDGVTYEYAGLGLSSYSFFLFYTFMDGGGSRRHSKREAYVQ